MKAILYFSLLIFGSLSCDLHFDNSKVYILDKYNFEDSTKVDGLSSFWLLLFHNASNPESFNIFEKMRPLAEIPSKNMEFGIIDWF